MEGGTKHTRSNPSLLDDAHSDSYLQPLTCARVVCENGPDILRLPQVVDKLSDFLDNSRLWTLPEACASGSLDLVERLLARQKAEGPTSFLNRPDYRQWQFDCSLLEAGKVGNLEIAQLLAKHFRDCYVSLNVVNSAAARGLTEFLTWMDEWGCASEWDADAVSDAIRNGFFELATWLQKKLLTTSVRYMGQASTEWAIVAAGKGDLDMVKRYCAILSERNTDGSLRYLTDGNLWRAVQRASDSGHLHVVQWMMEEPNRKVLLYELLGREFERVFGGGIDLSSAAGGGHIDLLTWLIEHYPEYCIIGNAGSDAARYGNLDLFRLLFYASIKKPPTPNLIDVAAGNGHLDIVKFLLAEGYRDNKAMDNAAKNGYLEIVKWLHENASHSCSTAAMDGAASNGHLDVVKWLHDNREEGCTTSAMNGAVQQGHLEVVQWLNENRTEGCTASAMHEAAWAGNLEMVKWLHFNRSEGCTTTAMNCAAGNGHLDVVKWLHSNRLEGCTTEAMDLAAGSDYLEVLKWLDQNRTEGFTAKAMHGAVWYGNFKVLQWLLSRRPELCEASLMSVAVARGHFDIVWFLYQNHCECGSIESLKKALRPLYEKEFAEWAYAHHRQEFERNIAEHLFAD